LSNQQESQAKAASQQMEICLEAREVTVPPGEGPPVIMIEDEVVATVAEHGQQDTSREQGGVLMGRATTGEQGTVVCVEAAIPAAHTQASRSRVTFTHDSWNDIYQVIDSQYPTKQIVGWYHTHPGFGIFLSEYDLFIHRNFFTAPWQIAYVIDPVSGESGCFSWREGEIGRTDSYNVYRPAAPSELPALEPVSVVSASQREATGQLRLLSGVILAVLGLLLALQVTNLLVSTRTPGTGPSTEEALPAAVRTESPAEAGISLDEIREELAQLQAELGMVYQWYTVKPGDSLWKIAENAYGRGDMAGLVAAENGLDPAEPALEPGMRLRLPKLPEKPDD